MLFLICAKGEFDEGVPANGVFPSPVPALLLVGSDDCPRPLPRLEAPPRRLANAFVPLAARPRPLPRAGVVASLWPVWVAPKTLPDLGMSRLFHEASRRRHECVLLDFSCGGQRRGGYSCKEYEQGNKYRLIPYLGWRRLPGRLLARVVSSSLCSEAARSAQVGQARSALRAFRRLSAHGPMWSTIRRFS